MKFINRQILFACLSFVSMTAWGEIFRLPTANRSIFEPGKEEGYFVGTVGKTWISGTYGCVRSEGNQLHEGIDVKCIQRDRKGEPTDPVMATADGVVAYINPKASLSNFGIYVVLCHRIEGLEIYSIYSHLREVRSGLKHGDPVKAGETIGIMGRTANTRQGISKDRAHVHFELNLIANDRFAEWYKKYFSNQRNDHGVFNGQNFMGLDPRLIFLAQQREGANFSLLKYVRQQTEYCRILVKGPACRWVQRYAVLVQKNPKAEKEGIAGYELAFTYSGAIFEAIPRAASEIKGNEKYQVVSANAAEVKRNPARHLIERKNNQWELTSKGTHLLNLYTF